MIELRAAQTDLLAFCRRMDSKFQTPAHIVRIAELLEAVESGVLKRLIINLPPGHGKSRLLQLFAAWYLGKDSTRKGIFTANSAALVERNSRETRLLFEDSRFPFQVKLSADSTAVGQWTVTPGRGGLYAIGVEGKVTGFRGNLIVCDDIEHDASSESEQNTTWTWFSEVLMPRLEPGGAVVLIGTRWSMTDVFGRIADSPDADAWKVLRAAAISTDDESDPFGRKSGEPLWPGRWSSAELERRKVEMGTRAFDAQYQCDPTPQSGLTFKGEWFANAPRFEYDRLPDGLFVVQFCDSAWKTGVQNDWSVIATWATNGRDYYIVDVWRGKVQYADLKHVARRVFYESKFRPSALCVEETAAGYALISELKRDTGIPVIPIQVRTQSKGARAVATTPYFEAARVHLPKSAPWLEQWISEHLRFPAGRNDDMVDTTSMALNWLPERVRPQIQLQSVADYYGGPGIVGLTGGR